jgi:hypothetical protein
MFTGSGEQFSLAMALEQYAEEILALADKYDVIPLKYHCERVLAERLTPRNVCEVLLFADTYSYVSDCLLCINIVFIIFDRCSSLKRACVLLLQNEHKVVLQTDEWRQLKRDNPPLANELLESIVSGNDVPVSGVHISINFSHIYTQFEIRGTRASVRIVGGGTTPQSASSMTLHRSATFATPTTTTTVNQHMQSPLMMNSAPTSSSSSNLTTNLANSDGDSNIHLNTPSL